MIAGGSRSGFAASRFLKASSSRATSATRRDADATDHGAPRAAPASAGRRCRRPDAGTGLRRGRRATGGAGRDAEPGDRGAERMATPRHGDAARPRPIGELVKDLASQTSTLVRQEIKLAQAEVTQKGKLAGKGAGMLGRRRRRRAARRSAR